MVRATVDNNHMTTTPRPRTRLIKVFVREDLMKQLDALLLANPDLTLTTIINSTLSHTLANKEAICYDARSFQSTRHN